ncbi:3-coathanger stack domain-containing protein [Pareuzebyella sediminis]|uniref:3-coathanger stack domain-containing protein n=1 Tax=Pareuzebyella sediminis TaxID=2607998 RepID=UPI0011ED5A11|nr:3-coathanger stack domain-containing protein [Pareuzebyella sediminis]
MKYKITHNIRALLCLITLTLFGGHTMISQTTVKASSFGYSSTDATLALQKALNSNYDKVIIDYKSSGWNIGPLKLFDISNKEIVFESGVVVRALKGRFKGSNDALLNLVRARNLKISGYGATFKMDKDELISYDSKTEYRHSLQFTGGDNISVKGLTLEESGGDGVYITGSNVSVYAKNIVLEDLKVLNHARDGISLISADGVLVKNCVFSGTKSNILGCGVNFEPNTSDQRLRNIVFKNSTIKNNHYYGIQVSLKHLTSSSNPIDITFEDCYLTNNFYKNTRNSPSEIRLGVGKSFNNAARGLITFDNTTIENVDHPVMSSRKPSTAFMARFTNCDFLDISSTSVYLETPSYSITSPPLGGFEFNNVRVSGNTTDPFLKIYGYSTMDGLKDVTGDFVVANSKLNKDNAIVYSRVYKFTNVDVDYKFVSSLSTGSTSSTSSSSGDCVSSVTLSSTISSATTKQASSTITATNDVTHSSGTVTYKAGSKVVLKPGFSVKADGSEVFKAVLGNCSGSSGATALKAKSGFYHNWRPEAERMEEVGVKPTLTPNPINTYTVMRFMVEQDDYISVNIYDINNQLVRSVIADQRMYAGPQRVEVDFSSLMAGFYMVSIEGSFERRMVKAIKN